MRGARRVPGPADVAVFANRRVLAAALAVAVAASARAGQAAEPPANAPGPAKAPAPPSPTERELTFSAREVELDAKGDRVALKGDVTVVVDRYRLTSDRLVLDKTPRGVVVDGPGRVAFCPCPSPPLTLGFKSALAAPPTDLLLEQPTLRFYGLPIFWLPYFWMRSPSRLGLLPLEVGYRGEDGFVAGAGVHVPVSDSSLDVTGAGYFTGGADVRVRWYTPDTSTSLRWDHVDTSLGHADLRGVERVGEAGGVAWSADVLRGERALGGPSDLPVVALRQDRARAAAGVSEGPFTIAFIAGAESRRGAAFRAPFVAGPGAHAGFGAALGRAGAVALDVDATTLRIGPDRAATLVAQRAELRADAWTGPVALSLEGRSRAEAAIAEAETQHAVRAAAGATAALPFMREFGQGQDELVHSVAPFVTAVVGAGDARLGAEPASGFPLGDGSRGAIGGIAGVETTLGATAGSRAAVTLEADGAAVRTGGEEWTPLASARAGARARFVAARGQGSFAPGDRAGFAAFDLRVGPEGGPFLSGHAEGEAGPLPSWARWFSGRGASFEAPWSEYVVPDGWTAGAGAGVPWTRFLSTVVAGDYDLTRRTLLGVRGVAAYRHPCRCLAVRVGGEGRIGRKGLDLWLAVDLMP
jgi:hypothetical protein